MTAQIIDQETIDKVINGVDYGKKPRLLARSPEYILIWIPTQMIAIKRKITRETITICAVARLSGAVFLNHATAIDKIFGKGSYVLLAPNKTVVFDDCKPWSIYGNEVPIGPHNFGYSAEMEKKVIRDRLKAEGITDETALHFAVETAYIEAHKNDLTLRERQDIWMANFVKKSQEPKPVIFTKEEIEFLKDHFDMANDPTAQSILAKVRKL
jgi:hypothetical protein